MKIIEDICGVSVYEMNDGEIATIVKWDSHDQYIGRIVQRFGEDLVSLGQPRMSSWPCYFSKEFSKESERNFRVRILPHGTRLEI